MTQTTKVRPADVSWPVKQHADGGTYTVIAFANTQPGWGIAITKWITYTGGVAYEICRVDPNGAMLRLKTVGNEAEARTFANRAWTHDR